MKKFAVWKNHEVIGYVELTEEQAHTLNKLPLGVYFGFDGNTKPEAYKETH